MPTNRAVLYLRSSKDRADVSIDAQRRQLQALAIERDLVVVGEYADSVERADDMERHGLRGLLRDLKAANREWSSVVMLDTARLARQDQGFAFVFDQECEKRGVRVIYKMLPEAHPVMDLVFRQMVRAWDMLHSLMSREKGLAGMAENVRQGHRAGGRAPFGYRLVHEGSGATRDGAPVLKSRLEPTDDAPKIAAYLKDRAAGVPRLRARERAGLSLRDTTLIGIEWNALTYAGNTVWNVHAERVAGGYKGGTKRRKRAEWIVQPGTHKALIEPHEAEALLAKLEASTRRRARTGDRIYLLTGLLRTPDGGAWHGDHGAYRAGKGRKVEADRVEQAVLAALTEQLQSEAIVLDLQRSIRALYAADDSGDELKRLDAKIRDLTRQITKVSDMLAETTAPQALLRSIEAWETQRTVALDRKLAIEERSQRADRARNIKASDVRALIQRLVADLRHQDRAGLKDALASVIDAVILDPETFDCELRIAPLKRGDKLASPRDSAAIPYFPAKVEIPRNRTYRRKVLA